MTLRWQEEPMEEAKQRFMEALDDLKEFTCENTDSLLKDAHVKKADAVKISPQKIVILAHLGKHVQTLHIMVPIHDERKVTLSDVVTEIRQVVANGRDITKLDLSTKIASLPKKVKRLSGIIESNDMEL